MIGSKTHQTCRVRYWVFIRPFFQAIKYQPMKRLLEEILRHPKVKQEIIRTVGIASGFAARKLFTLVLRRAIPGAAAAVEMLVIYWISRHPEWVEKWLDRISVKTPATS